MHKQTFILYTVIQETIASLTSFAMDDYACSVFLSLSGFLTNYFKFGGKKKTCFDLLKTKFVAQRNRSLLGQLTLQMRKLRLREVKLTPVVILVMKHDDRRKKPPSFLCSWEVSHSSSLH